MRLHSFCQQSTDLVPIEVEVTLVPGLPMIHFLGQPDRNIVESAKRIKAAIQKQGFRFPRAQQVLVNLRPNHLKKTCYGLDLAVAIAILHLTRQMRLSFLNEDITVYGELSLSGEILVPNDLKNINLDKKKTILTGFSEETLPHNTLQAKNLSSLSIAVKKTAIPVTHQLKRPEFSKFRFSKTQAKLLKIIALGEHSALLAGPSGNGKTTLIKQVVSLLKEPETKTFQEAYKTWKSVNNSLSWRPEVSPHHTVTARAMLGGSYRNPVGDIALAHGGALILDELLEFSKEVFEALREPCDNKQFQRIKGMKVQSIPSNFLMLATTNLCPCGNFTPKQPENCKCSNLKRRNYLQRISGPFLDRFQILNFTEPPHEHVKASIPLPQIWSTLTMAREFVAKAAPSRCTLGRPAGALSLDELRPFISDFAAKNILPQKGFSKRRELATLRVARSIADLEQSLLIRDEHLGEALQFSHLPFIEISQRNSM